MRCRFCSSPATIHIVDVAQQQKMEVHLCEACAEKLQIVATPKAPELSIPAVMQLLMAQTTPVALELTCPECGLQYGEFRETGRLGCPHDYDVFYTPLLTLLERIHLGAMHQGGTRHIGKQPRLRNGRPLANESELGHRFLPDAVSDPLTQSPRLSDRIHRKDATEHEPG